MDIAIVCLVVIVVAVPFVMAVLRIGEEGKGLTTQF
jgi:hypothetical protein